MANHPIHGEMARHRQRRCDRFVAQCRSCRSFAWPLHPRSVAGTYHRVHRAYAEVDRGAFSRSPSPVTWTHGVSDTDSRALIRHRSPLGGPSARAKRRLVRIDDLALYLYTSGATGLPKAARGPMRASCNGAIGLPACSACDGLTGCTTACPCTTALTSAGARRCSCRRRQRCPRETREPSGALSFIRDSALSSRWGTLQVPASRGTVHRGSDAPDSYRLWQRAGSGDLGLPQGTIPHSRDHWMRCHY